MVLSTFVSIIVIASLCYAAYRILKKAWHRADLEDMIDEVEMTSEEVELSNSIDLEEYEKQKQRLEEVLKNRR